MASPRLASEMTVSAVKSKTATKAVPEFSVYSLSYLEQQVFLSLYYSKHALNAFEVYKLAVKRILLEQDEKMDNYTKKIKNKAGELMPGHLLAVLSDDWLAMKKENFMAIVNVATQDKFKQSGIQIPRFVRVQSILQELSDSPLKWISKREGIKRDDQETVGKIGKASAVYYLDDSIREKIQNQLSLRPS